MLTISSLPSLFILRHCIALQQLRPFRCNNTPGSVSSHGTQARTSLCLTQNVYVTRVPCESQRSDRSVVLSNPTSDTTKLDVTASGSGIDNDTTIYSRRKLRLLQLLHRTQVHPTPPSSPCLYYSAWSLVTLACVCWHFFIGTFMLIEDMCLRDRSHIVIRRCRESNDL
ncbi:hypothetical protein EV424DRAFT_303662 [Suillus variegatus]|nr:hypothetical protein EV424DRAFT_303662 [Suillus variegatus]